MLGRPAADWRQEPSALQICQPAPRGDPAQGRSRARFWWLGLPLLANMLLLAWLVPRLDWQSVDIDFTPLYAAASVGPDQAMDFARMTQRIQSIGRAVPARSLWARLPGITLLYTPLARLDYFKARLLWRILTVLFLAGSVAIWSRGNPAGYLVLFGYLPALYLVLHGQDSGVGLLAASIPLLSPGILTGLVFGVCMLKFHLFLFLPAALAARREWRLIIGGFFGCLAIVIASFLTAGWTWPKRLLGIAGAADYSPFSDRGPGLRILFEPHPVLFGILVVASLAGVYWMSRRLPTRLAVAMALAVGVVVNSHSYLVDCVLLLPLIVIGLASAGPTYAFSLFLMSPFPHAILLTTGFGTPLRFSIAVVVAELRRKWSGPPAGIPT